MIVFRICKAPYTALDGEGSRLYGGRWNTAGKPAVYTSYHLSLAALEYLVHVDFDNLPIDLVWLKIEVPDASTMQQFPNATAQNERDAASFGDAWMASVATVGLVVPSAVLAVENNLILNPLHAEMRAVRILETSPFQFDDRLFKR